MSATEILSELPKVIETERPAERSKLSERAAENDEIALCDQAALEGALSRNHAVEMQVVAPWIFA